MLMRITGPALYNRISPDRCAGLPQEEIRPVKADNRRPFKARFQGDGVHTRIPH